MIGHSWLLDAVVVVAHVHIAAGSVRSQVTVERFDPTVILPTSASLMKLVPA